MSEYDMLAKIILLGEDQKIKDYIFEPTYGFQDHYKMTIGADFGIVNFEIEGRIIKLQIWDIECAERFSYMRPMFYRGALGAIIVTTPPRLLNAINFMREVRDTCGAIPLNLVIACSNQSATTLEEGLQQISHQIYLNPRELLSQPKDLYALVAQDTYSMQSGASYGTRLTYLTEMNYREIVDSQEDYETIINQFLEYIASRSSTFGVWDTSPGIPAEGSVIQRPIVEDIPAQRRNTVFLDTEVPKERSEKFFEILSSIGALIDKEKMVASVINEMGLFEINMRSGSVNFIPNICLDCEKDCEHPSASLCIVQETTGWTNYELNKKELLIVAKIFAIKNLILPADIIQQIKSKNICNPNRNINTIATLRDDMLRELDRLKRIMRGNPSSDS